MKNLKLRLIVMNFLEFAVWGAYLTSMGGYLATHGLADNIGWFYAVQGIVSLFMPALLGIVADRWIPAQKVLSLAHTIAGVFMAAAGYYAMTAGDAVQFAPLFALYTISVAFFMPTIGLANSVAFNALTKAGMDTVKDFPPIRVFGTIGFICSMLTVDFTGLQHTFGQFFVSGGLSLVLAAYALTLPDCPVSKEQKSQSWIDIFGLRAFTLFKNPRMAIFFIFSMLLGVSLQITNGFANPFLTAFGDLKQYADTFAAQHANALISLSQISETLCILLIPFCMKRFGIKNVMLIAMFAWVFRFGFFGMGNPGMPGVILFVLSCIVYGVAFDFFNISGALYVDQQTDESIRSSAQGLFMIMTNGIGATIGTLSAQAVVTHFVNSQTEPAAIIQGWSTSWYIFAAYALVVAVSFMLIFKAPEAQKPIEK
ncbi:MAG: MFS transporter [Muribaculaceae bacterium]|nr:MFS transporter [Muribaculaceae bacterium]HAP49775.1 MFS transporter [Porphyromonadaceae bacterium]